MTREGRLFSLLTFFYLCQSTCCKRKEHVCFYFCKDFVQKIFLSFKGNFILFLHILICFIQYNTVWHSYSMAAAMRIKSGLGFKFWISLYQVLGTRTCRTRNEQGPLDLCFIGSRVCWEYITTLLSRLFEGVW